jgi:hypothetical protein
MMRPYYSTSVVAAAVASLCACSSVSTQGPAHDNRVIATGSGVRQTDNTLTSDATTVNAPPAAMLSALSAAYADLGIEVKLWNPQTGEVGNRNFTKMYRMAGRPMSDYLGCGTTTTGQAADNYRITMSFVSRVTPNGSGSKVETTLTAYAEDISSSKGTLACLTLGTLEQRLQQLALGHVRS